MESRFIIIHNCAVSVFLMYHNFLIASKFFFALKCSISCVKEIENNGKTPALIHDFLMTNFRAASGRDNIQLLLQFRPIADTVLAAIESQGILV